MTAGSATGYDPATLASLETTRLRRKWFWRRLPVMALCGLAALAIGAIDMRLHPLPHQVSGNTIRIFAVINTAVIGMLAGLWAEVRRVRRLGAWGTGSFDNPEAVAWVRELDLRGESPLEAVVPGPGPPSPTCRDGTATTGRALEATASSGYLGVAVERRAVATAELVVSALEGPVRPPGSAHLPPEAIRWLSQHDAAEVMRLSDWALFALDRTEADGHLRGPNPALEISMRRIDERLLQARSIPRTSGNRCGVATAQWAAHERSVMTDRVLWAVGGLAILTTMVLYAGLISVGLRDPYARWSNLLVTAGAVMLVVLVPFFLLTCAWRVWKSQWFRHRGRRR